MQSFSHVRINALTNYSLSFLSNSYKYFQDFGDSIPGHGGFTDRMDCQMVMAIFAYIYFQSFVLPQTNSVEMILDQVLSPFRKLCCKILIPVNLLYAKRKNGLGRTIKNANKKLCTYAYHYTTDFEAITI